MDAELLTALRIAGPAVAGVAVWSVWQCRVAFGSRIDRGGAVAILLFGIGSALVAPWPQLATVLYPLTGRFHVLTMTGNLCFVVGGALVVKAVYCRLMSDAAFEAFTRKWLLPTVFGVIAIMVLSFAASCIPRSAPGDLHLATPDGWLICYWCAHYAATTLFGVLAVYGVWHLRRDPRSVLLIFTMAALALAALCGGVVGGYSAVTGRMETLRMVGWLLTYVAFAVAFVVSALQWRHRVRALAGSPARRR